MHGQLFFKLEKKNFQPAYDSLSAVMHRAIGINSLLPDFTVAKNNVPWYFDRR